MSGDAALQRRVGLSDHILAEAREYTDQQLLSHGAAGRELAYAALGTSVVLDGPTADDQDVPGLQIAPVLGARPALLNAALPLAVRAGSGDGVVVVAVSLWDVGWDELTRLGHQTITVPLRSAQPIFVTVHVRRRIAPSPGAHAFRLGCRITGDPCELTVLGAERGAEAFVECVER